MIPKPKIAFLCDRLGPYHMARLNAASLYSDIIAIEFSVSDETYDWDIIDSPCDFSKVTLFNDKSISNQPISLVIKRVNEVLDNIRPQVVAIPGWDAAASLIALFWCLQNHTPTILMSDSQKHDQVRVWWQEIVKRWIVKLHSTGFVAGSTHVNYLHDLGMPSINIVTGLDVVDNDFFFENANSSKQNSVSLLSKFQLPNKYFLSSSRFVAKKNIPLLLTAYARYCKLVVGEPWKLVLLGDGPLKQNIIALRDSLDLRENLLMPGFKQYDELPTYYGLSGAFVHSSTSEQWGLVVNEAMACGLPVIVSKPCGCVPELVVNGFNGFSFNPTDSDELSKLLLLISSESCNREIMGKSSREIISRFSPDSFATNLAQIAKISISSVRPRMNFLEKILLWCLIRRIR